MPNVVIPKAEVNKFDLPAVCVVTGETDGVVWKEMKFQWVPPWARLFGVLIQALVMKKVTGEVPWSPAAWSAWKKGQVVMVVSVLGMIFAPVGLGAALPKNPEIAGIAFLAGLVGLIVVYFAMLKGRYPKCVKIDDKFIELDLPSAKAVQMIQERLGKGRIPPKL